MYHLSGLVLFFIIFLTSFTTGIAQNSVANPVDITVVSEDEITPSIIKALPEWEKYKDSATRIKNTNELKKVAGENKVFDLISFVGGNEGVSATYPDGQLLIIEFQTPQFSVDTDSKIQQYFAANPANPAIYYRRVGNYSVFVLNAKDETSAVALLDRVKYEKVVQWLGEDPNYLKKAEQYFVRQASQLFMSTIIVIVGGISLAVILGAIVGLAYFRLSNQRRSEMVAFSDAGGMTRLNLDDLGESGGLLKK